MDKPPYDQRLARILVRPLAGTPLTPNHITLLTLALGLGAAWLFATGDPVAANWGAGVFVLARFLDHFDGELARLTGQTSRLGYYLDYVSGGLSYGGLCSVRSGNLASPRAGVYPGAGRSVILVIHESVQTNMENQYAERPG